jgi:hypothetical protein
MIEVPRINHWARMVVEIDRISRDGGVFVAQTKKHCQSILDVRGRLLRIYLTHWDDKEIGYPNTIDILRRWDIEPSEHVEQSVKYLRDLVMYIKCIDLDMMAVNIAIEDNAESEKCLAD